MKTLCSIEVGRIYRKWAGLRTFAPNRGLVAGFAQRPGFFWLVGQGGSGIKTSPATARLACSLIVSDAIPADIESLGLSNEMISPWARRPCGRRS